MKSVCNAEDDGINRCVENIKKARLDGFSDNQDNYDLKVLETLMIIIELK